MRTGSDVRKPRLTELLSFRLFGVAAFVLVVLFGFWVRAEILAFQGQADRIRLSMLSERQSLLRDVIHQTVRTVEYQRRQADARVRQRLMRRVNTAVAVAQRLWSTYAEVVGRRETERMIRDSLGALGQGDTREGPFVFDVAGRADVSVTPPRGTTGRPAVADMLEAIRTNGGAGFLEYSSAPSGAQEGAQPGESHRMLAYGKRVDGLDWVIGIADDLDATDKEIQRSIGDWLSTIRFGGASYVFAVTWDGDVIAGPGRGRNMLDVTDADGMYVVRALIDAARAGGGFVEYIQPDVLGAESFRTGRKLSYVEPIPGWQWYVGAGLYVDDVEREVAAVRATLKTKISWTLAQGVGLFLLLAALSYWLTRRSTRSLNREVYAFERFFATDGRDAAGLDPEAMTSREFETLARAARAMAHSRDGAEAVLADRTRQLERSNTDLERFAWIASHDLQEPLRSVASFLQLLERRLGPRLNAEESEFLAYAVNGARRMRAQIVALMTYARQQTDRVNPEVVSLQQIVDEVRDLFSVQFEAVGARCEADGLPTVFADPALLATVLQNLISNALKFRDPDRPLRLLITAEPMGGGDPQSVRVTVADNGSGIPVPYRGDAFALLKRLHGGDIPGTGVGLAIVKSLIEAQGGRVGMKDGLEGDGVAVWFTLPALRPGGEGADGQGSGDGSSDGPGDGRSVGDQAGPMVTATSRGGAK